MLRIRLIAAAAWTSWPTTPPLTSTVAPVGCTRTSSAITIPAAEEVGRALDVAPTCFRPSIAACASAGLRSGEAAGLRLEDVDFLRRTVSARHQLQGGTNPTTELGATQFGSERVVYAPAELIAVLAERVRRTGLLRGHRPFSTAALPLDRNSAAHQWRQVRTVAVRLDGYPCTT
ncbi:hypothetical protein ACU610_16780 [Geodermatophilus sp. URMC 61]|uniref:hypothetical protein n=1 Tax=Geodermatophilus sp. URMC 61 TaxID=3423411 RepID=UPI00406CF3A8